MSGRECKWCGADISGRSARSKYCARNCAVAASNARRTRLDDPKCAACMSTFQRRGTTDVYCSLQCSRAVKNRSRRKSTPVKKKCQVCEAQFTTNVSAKVFCSTSCKKRSGYLRGIEAQRARCRSYRAMNVEYHRERAKAWREDNRLRVSEYNSGYSKRPKAIESRRNRYEAIADDPVWVMSNRIRSRVAGLIERSAAKSSGTFDMLGYTPQELAAHLERQFVKGMGWHNRDKWHIDHIVPISTAKTIEDVIALNQLSNLRPLWAQDNLRKSDKLEYMI